MKSQCFYKYLFPSCFIQIMNLDSNSKFDLVYSTLTTTFQLVLLSFPKIRQISSNTNLSSLPCI